MPLNITKVSAFVAAFEGNSPCLYNLFFHSRKGAYHLLRMDHRLNRLYRRGCLGRKAYCLNDRDASRCLIKMEKSGLYFMTSFHGPLSGGHDHIITGTRSGAD